MGLYIAEAQKLKLVERVLAARKSRLVSVKCILANFLN